MSPVSVDALLLRVEYPKAVYAVACPLCHARPGARCVSTGGGHGGEVAPHEKRYACLTGWTGDQLAEAQRLVVEQGRKAWWHMPAGYYDVTRGWAVAAATAKRTLTPRGVPLSELQAEEIERAAANAGALHVSTVHFHGDHQDRQSTNALERKGILRDTGRRTEGGYERVLELTAFGWQVYRQHRLVMRRLSDDVAAQFEAHARDGEIHRARMAQVDAVAEQVADVPGAVAPRVERMVLPLRKPSAATVTPLAPFRRATVVDLESARRARHAKVAPTGGQIA